MKHLLPTLSFIRISIFLLLVFFSLPIKVTADTESDFSTHIDSEYKINTLGNTIINHNFTITNLTPSRYISKYAIQTSYPELNRVEVSSNGKKIDAHIVSDENTTSIAIDFPDEVVGQGKQRKFTISYETPDIALIAGKVLELNIPKLAQQDTSTSHDVQIITPKKFGAPIRVTPNNYKADETTEDFITKFDNLGSEPISGIFGKNQIFSLNLRYHLENPSSSAGKVQISIPPDTSFQKIRYYSIEPPTNDLKRDGDGNWIATYDVPAQTISVVNLVADVMLTLDPIQEYLVPAPTSDHVATKQYWELSEQTKKYLPQNLNDVKAINDFVASTLQYNYGLTELPITRKGAETALEHPQDSMCQEFTDVFISLARQNSIPSRRITGYAYTQNNQLRPLSLEGDVLHAWPEFYDPSNRVWRPLDPTWQNTTGGIDYFSQFDLNHVTFAINGLDSSKPYPAGSYKPNQVETKDIEVTFGKEFPESKPRFSISYVPKTIMGIEIPGIYSLHVSNDTGEAWYNVDFKQQQINTSATSLYPSELTFPIIMPFEDIDQLVWFFNKETWTFDTTQITATLQVSQYEPVVINYIVKTLPGLFVLLSNEKILISLVISIIIITLATGSILVFRQRK